ncbi:MAG TPA: FkbM family methyltransferase [Candidatus Nanoarchaeia archaeon]|nr:FkbM family methyltransferase [Candidatus Nanoarchaeia archaeon]
MNTKLNSTTRTFKRQLTDWITSTYWKMFHPRIVSRFGIKFKIDPQVVPYYIIRRKTFRSLLPVFDHYVTSNSIVLDIGASFGFYSLYSLINRKAKTVIAFEPTARSYNLLQENIELNKVNIINKNNKLNNLNKIKEEELNLKSYRCAVSDKPGRAKLHLDSAGFGYNSLLGNKMNSSKNKYEWVDVQTVDNLVQHADLVKMDVEGMEYFVLLGMKKLLFNSRPPVLLEYTASNQYKKEINNFLESLGYKISLRIGNNVLAVYGRDVDKVWGGGMLIK